MHATSAMMVLHINNKYGVVSAFHGGNFDDLASILAMICTVVVFFCVLFSQLKKWCCSDGRSKDWCCS